MVAVVPKNVVESASSQLKVQENFQVRKLGKLIPVYSGTWEACKFVRYICGGRIYEIKTNRIVG